MGGFFLAAQGSIDILLLLLTLIGTTLVVASGCVVNNVIDQDIDTKMQRTQNRALVKNHLSYYCACICFRTRVMGFSILWFDVNGYAFLFAMIGFIVYVGFIVCGLNVPQSIKPSLVVSPERALLLLVIQQ